MDVQTIFGQMVVGPPGSGKSSYCKYICANLRQLGRNAKIINLDPANDCLPYKPAIDINELIKVETVMKNKDLGPNGAMIYCFEKLNDNFGWLYDKIVDLVIEEKKVYDERLQAAKKDQEADNGNHQDQQQIFKDPLRNRPYLLFDCPGQSELYTHYKMMKEITTRLTTMKDHFDLRLVCMNLCDSYHASDLSKYVGLVMNSLSTMINLELPHLNVLTKLDLIEQNGGTRFRVEYYCECANLQYLLETEMESPFLQRYRKLTSGIMDLIENYGMVSFLPLDINKSEDILVVLQMADKANGYTFDDLDLALLQQNPRLVEMASGKRLEPVRDAISELIKPNKPTHEEPF